MTAIFYDVENLQDPSNYRLSIEKLQEVYGDLRLCLQFAYADWRRISEQDREVFVQNGVILKQVINGVGYSSSIKNIADITLCVDAMELLGKNSLVDKFVIVSGDGGYISLVNKLKEYGKSVEIISIRSHMNKTLANYTNATHYIDETSVCELAPQPENNNDIVDTMDDNTIESSSAPDEQKKRENPMYLRAAWAIFKSYNDIDEIIKILFSNIYIKKQILEEGLLFIKILNSYHYAKRIPASSEEVKRFKSKIKECVKKDKTLYFENDLIKRKEKNASEEQVDSTEKCSKKELIAHLSNTGITISATNITQELFQEIFVNKDMYFSLAPVEFKQVLYQNTKRSKKFIDGVFKILDLLSMDDITKANVDNYKDIIAAKLSMFLSTKLKHKTKKKDILECFEWDEQKTKVMEDKI